jgi:hypothetical protein
MKSTDISSGERLAIRKKLKIRAKKSCFPAVRRRNELLCRTKQAAFVSRSLELGRAIPQTGRLATGSRDVTIGVPSEARRIRRIAPDRRKDELPEPTKVGTGLVGIGEAKSTAAGRRLQPMRLGSCWAGKVPAQCYCRKNEKKSGAPTRGHEANVSMMNSPGPGWAYMPRKTTSPWETSVSPPSPPSGIGPNV